MAKYQPVKDLKTDRLGSDIVIANARLLKDTESGDMLIQVRLKKVSDEPVSAVKVRVVCFDEAGKKVGRDITESFACNAANGEYFGVKHPIHLEVKNASDASVSIADVEYPCEESVGEAEKKEESAVHDNGEADEHEETKDVGNDSAESPEPSVKLSESAPAEVKAEDDTAKKILMGFAAATVLVIGVGAAVHFGTQNKPAADPETLVAEMSETTASSAAEDPAVTAAAKTEKVTEAQTETQLPLGLDKSIRTCQHRKNMIK